MKIFNIILLSLLFVAPVAVHADDDLDDCVMFNPAFALCSTHSHNTGFVSNGLPANPSNAEDIAYMNEVIGMKTTVIVQQMKQQYDTLNAMIKRFKTQLEKAVLTSKLEAYTGNTSSSSNSGWSTGGGSGGGSAQNNGISAEECEYMTQDQVYDCLLRNFSKIRAAIDSDRNAASKQLYRDIKTMDNDNMCDAENACETKICDNKIDEYGGGTKNEILDCIGKLTAKVRNKKTDYEQKRYGRYRD